MKRKRVVRISVIVLACLAVGSAVGWKMVENAGASAGTPALTTAPAKVLANGGISLRLPARASRVSEQRAAELARRQFPGATVREEVLAQVHDQVPVPAVDCLCWAVSIMPASGIWASGGKPNSTRLRLDYDIVLINADTGGFVEAIRGGKVP
jgi:hypothetical protein